MFGGWNAGPLDIHGCSVTLVPVVFLCLLQDTLLFLEGFLTRHPLVCKTPSTRGRLACLFVCLFCFCLFCFVFACFACFFDCFHSFVCLFVCLFVCEALARRSEAERPGVGAFGLLVCFLVRWAP